MNPQFEQSPGLRLPQPSSESAVPEHAVSTEVGQEGVAQTLPIPPPPHPDYPATTQPVALQQPSLPATPTITATVGDDSDDTKLDEEWIAKAKKIVEVTRDDPYRQSHEMSKFKAGYLQTRHNKAIKTVEDRQK